MRWLLSLFAMVICLLGVALVSPDIAPRLSGYFGLALIGMLQRRAGAAQAWIEARPGLMGYILIGLGLGSLLAANIRTGTPRVAGVEIVFDAKAPHYVEHDVWRDPANEPLPGLAYRVGVRNRLRATVHDAMVIVTVEEGKPSVARFMRHKTYTSDIEPLGTELVELFLLRDQDVAAQLHIEQTVKVRVSATDAAPATRTFKFDSRAAVPLTPM